MRTASVRRSAAALGAVALVLTGAACTTGSPAPTEETTEPVPIEPNQEVGETLPPANPTDGAGGTEG